MIIPTWQYWFLIIALFVIGIIIMFRQITKKHRYFNAWSIPLKLLAIALLFLKTVMPYVYEVTGYDSVEKNILLFPLNSFGGDLKMGDHCYVINATDRDVILRHVGNNTDYENDSIIVPLRSEKKILIPRIAHFFKSTGTPSQRRLLQDGWALNSAGSR